jgi:hypothetical protein
LSSSVVHYGRMPASGDTEAFLPYLQILGFA